MPVLTNEKYLLLKTELVRRINQLDNVFENRPLKTPKEGCKRQTHWVKPELMTATKGSDAELRMAIDDFKTILAEIRKLK